MTFNSDYKVLAEINIGRNLHIRVRCIDHVKDISIVRTGKNNRTSSADFTLERYVQFREYANCAEERLSALLRGDYIQKLEHHLGGDLDLKVEHPYRGVSLRHFIRGTGGHRVASSGVFLTPCEWKCFTNADDELNALMPEISRTVTCSSTHNNQEHGMTCFECHPGGEYLHLF